MDDEASILSSLRRLLRPTGYTIHTVASGQAGIEILEREPVDLVISDMRMPEMNGAQFLEQVRNRWPATMRILLTGYADISSTIDAINRGEIFRYVSKPWDDTEIRLTIRDALESSRLRRENARLLALTQAQNEELAQLNVGLERKVAERTAEIEQVNSFLNLATDRLKQNFLVSIKMLSGFMELRAATVVGAFAPSSRSGAQTCCQARGSGQARAGHFCRHLAARYRQDRFLRQAAGPSRVADERRGRGDLSPPPDRRRNRIDAAGGTERGCTHHPLAS